MDNSFRTIIDGAKEILILLPAKPDLDTVAAGLGLYLSLIPDKTVFISSPSSMTVEFNRLVGVNKIKGELGGKNLTVKLVDYPAKNVEKVSYDIVNDEFRLMVIPKEGMTPPGEDQVHLSYSGVSADTVILIGGNSESDFPALSQEELSKSKVAHVGIKELELTKDMGLLSFARPSSSISELVGQLIKEIGFKMDGDIATNLFAGIQKSTGSLSSSTVTADTLEISAYLMRSGAKRELPEATPRFPFPMGAMPADFGRVQPRPNPLIQKRDISEVEVKEEPAPKDWLQPKIFTGNKGTSVS